MSRTAIVGYTDLEVPVTHGERAAGLVVPASGFGAVHNVFALYHEAGSDRELLSRFVEARDSLGLMLTDGSALPLAARVELISVSDPHRIVVHVVVKDERYWALLRGGGASGTAAPGAGVVGRPPSPWSALHTPAASGTGPGLARPSWLSAWARPEGSRPITAQSVQTAQPAQSARPAQDGASPPRGFAGPAAGPA